MESGYGLRLGLGLHHIPIVPCTVSFQCFVLELFLIFYLCAPNILKQDVFFLFFFYGVHNSCRLIVLR